MRTFSRLAIGTFLLIAGMSFGFGLAGCDCNPSDIKLGASVWPSASDEPPSVGELLDVAYKYYPRWNPGKEPLNNYLVAYHHTPEVVALRTQVARVLGNDDKWQALIDDVRKAFPEYQVSDESAPTMDKPSFQLVIDYAPKAAKSGEAGEGEKQIIFRLSHLAPVYDYHEADRASQGSAPIAMHFSPTDTAKPVAKVVESKIARHFGYHRLPPSDANTPVLDIGVGSLRPGEVTLADALFDATRRF